MVMRQQLEKPGKDSTISQVPLRSEQHINSFSTIRTEHKDGSNSTTNVQVKHSTFARMLRNKAAIGIASGLIVSAALLSLTGCGSENPVKLVKVDESQWKQNSITLTSGYNWVFSNNGVSSVPEVLIPWVLRMNNNGSYVYVFDTKGKITVFYEDRPSNQEVQEYWFFNGPEIKDANTVKKIEDSIQKSLPNMKLKSLDPEAFATNDALVHEPQKNRGVNGWILLWVGTVIVSAIYVVVTLVNAIFGNPLGLTGNNGYLINKDMWDGRNGGSMFDEHGRPYR